MTQMNQEVDIVSILRYSVERGASDIVITAGLSPQFKIHGEWGSGEFTQSLNPNETRRLMYSIMNEKQQRNFEERRDIDFSFPLQGVARFRCNAFLQRGSVAGVMLIIPSTTKPMTEIGVPPVIRSQLASTSEYSHFISAARSTKFFKA